MADLINATDSLNTGRVKINAIIEDASAAVIAAESASATAGEAKTTANSVQTQLDTIILVDGASDAEVVQSRVDKDGKLYATLKERLDSSDAQLADITDNLIYLNSFPRIGAETDDTQRLQRAIDSFEGNVAGTIVIAEDIYISGQILTNKTGLKLKGVSNKKSRIISSYSGISLYVCPLYNGVPYTNTGYCKFYMDDITIQATGAAVETGTGLYLKWVYASSYQNLFTSGFKRHIVLKGSHLNTFFNYYAENADATEKGIEIHNRGVAMSADGEVDEAGETTSNNNTFIGGWIHNSSLDFRNMLSTKVRDIDIEPASNSIYTGDYAIFTGCRFERFNYYVVSLDPAPYGKFPWFIVGNHTKFYDNEYHQAGAHENATYPIFKVVGDYNEIEYPVSASYDTGTFNFADGATSNKIIIKKTFGDYQKTTEIALYKNELEGITGETYGNTIEYHDSQEGTSSTYVKNYNQASGVFKSVSANNNNLAYQDVWVPQGVEVTDLSSTELAFPHGYESEKFYKMRVSDGGAENKRLVMGDNLHTVTESGVYTMILTLYIPALTSVTPKFGPSPGTGFNVETREKWVTFQERGYFNSGDVIQPQIVLSGSLNDVIYFGMLNVVKGNAGAFFDNSTAGVVYKRL